ncbi:TIGR00153 family protein [Isoalcanivorax beigongshangi]|uniref:TIGR00153 family protein n=1 Tax=Isoalcanivorax beigongshangi TaxID=3238810 RepID=A0ABV4ADK9_9GAMM
MSLGSSIAGLFGRSPIKPLQKHYDIVQQCVAKLSDFFQAAIDNDWDQGAQLQAEIAKLENLADTLKKQFRLNLPNSLFLPMPRTDLLELISTQDRVANKAKDIAGLMLGRRMTLPPELADLMNAYVARAIDTSAQALKAINELDELLETGFGNPEIRMMEELIEVLDDIERETDRQQVQIRAVLFRLERELPPVDVMFLYKIIDWVGELADRAQKVGGQLHRIVAS